MTKNIVLNLSARGANDAIQGLMEDYGEALQQAGHAIVQVDMQGEASELRYAVELMRNNEVRFAMTWLGIGQELGIKDEGTGQTASAFEIFNVPLVKLQGDLPAYFPKRHQDIPRNCVNLYQASEFIEFRRRYVGNATALASLIPPIPMVPIERRSFDVTRRREGKLVFLKNGNSPVELRSLWQSRLPAATARLIVAMADAITPLGLKGGTLHIGDFVVDFLKSNDVGGEPPREMVCFFSAQMDDYLRRVKSTMIAEAILDFPVIVQGNFWRHLDFSGKRAQLLEGKDVRASHQDLGEQLGVIDMSANVDGWPHDRVQRGAGSFSLVLTNRQGWLCDNFTDFTDLIYEFDTDSIRHRIAEAIAKPDRYLDMAVAFGERFRVIYPRENFAQRVSDMVDHAMLLWNEPRPALQPFYVWPSRA
ncbi:MAG: hypothetical protein ABJC05_10195 [Pyrinomonadaceae bacterium]